MHCAQGLVRRAHSDLSKQSAMMRIVARKRRAVEEPKVDALIAHALLHNAEIGTVLGERKLQSPFAERQVVGGMKRHRAFRSDNNGTAAKRRQIVCFIRERSNSNSYWLTSEEMVEIRVGAFNITVSRKVREE